MSEPVVDAHADHRVPRAVPEDPRGDRPLRLLFIANPDSIHVRRWAGFFASRGHTVHVAGLWGASSTDRDASFHVHRLGRPETAFLRLRRIVREVRPQVLHAHYLTHYGWLVRAAGFRPYAVTLWGSDVLQDISTSPMRRLWARVVLRGAACVTADSPEIIDLAARLGAHRDTIHEVHFGVDTARFTPGPYPADLVDRLGLHGRRIIFAPRIVAPLYRTLTLVDALAALPDSVALVGTLAGADQDYAAKVAKAVSAAGLDARVRFVPPIPHGEIDAFYRAADVVATVPATDGTPVSILEALATGVLVVATDLPAVRPWLEHVAADLLVPVDDPMALAAALRRALSYSEVERARIVSVGRALAVARGEYSTNMLRVEGIYRTLVSG